MQRLLIIMTLSFLLSGCQNIAAGLLLKMGPEGELQAKNRRENVYTMPVDYMFPDEQVRELAIAAGKGRISTIEKLVNQGVDVNAKGYRGITPLFWAARKENIKGFTKLLELGADPNVVFESYTNSPGESIMNYISGKDYYDHDVDIRLLKAALAHGGNVNLYANKPWGRSNAPPIYSAVDDERLDVVELLLDAGADIDATTYKRDGSCEQTPLVFSILSSEYKEALFLLAKGADYTVRHHLCSGGSRSLQELLTTSKQMPHPFNKDAVNEISVIQNWLKAHGVTR